MSGKYSLGKVRNPLGQGPLAIYLHSPGCASTRDNMYRRKEGGEKEGRKKSRWARCVSGSHGPFSSKQMKPTSTI